MKRVLEQQGGDFKKRTLEQRTDMGHVQQSAAKLGEVEYSRIAGSRGSRGYSDADVHACWQPLKVLPT
jgi:hypothetical protein